MVNHRFARLSVSFLAACTAIIPAVSQSGGAQASLVETNWSLVTLAGRPVAQDGSQARLQFAAEFSNQSYHLSGAINAFDGCNTSSGQFEKNGPVLHISVGPFTALACASPQRLITSGGKPFDLRLSFADALRRTSRVEIHGTTLILEDRNGTVLAGFLNK